MLLSIGQMPSGSLASQKMGLSVPIFGAIAAHDTQGPGRTQRAPRRPPGPEVDPQCATGVWLPFVCPQGRTSRASMGFYGGCSAPRAEGRNSCRSLPPADQYLKLVFPASSTLNKVYLLCQRTLGRQRHGA
jgi:hypothetical protein